MANIIKHLIHCLIMSINDVIQQSRNFSLQNSMHSSIWRTWGTPYKCWDQS